MVKKTRKKGKREKQAVSLSEVGSIFLRIMKLMSDFFYIILLLFGMLGIGLAFGYLASQIDSVKVPSKASLVSQVSSVSRISSLTYSDGSQISEVDSDLLRTPVASNEISDNIKKAIIATEDENFNSHNGVVSQGYL